MALSLLRGRLCIMIILGTALLFLPLTASTTEGQLLPQPGQSFCEWAYNTAIEAGETDLPPLEEMCGEPPTPPHPLAGASDDPIIDTTANSNASAQSQSDDEVAMCVPDGGRLTNLPMPCEVAWRAYNSCRDAVNDANSKRVPPGGRPPNLSVSEVCHEPPIEVGSTSPAGVSVDTSLSGASETTVANQPIPSEVAIATGGIIAAGAGGVVLLYKQGYLKGTKKSIKNPPEKVDEPRETKPDNNLPIIELRIECGLENSEVIDREGDKGYNTITGELTEVEQKFNQAVNEILESRNKIKNIEKDIDFIKWCEEAKEDPNKILSKISEEVIGKFLGSIQPYFQNLMLSQIISIQSDISVTKDSPKRVRENITFNINPIQAYIELVVYSNELRVSSTKFIFAINSYAKIKNLTVYLEKVKRRQPQLKQQQPEQQVQYRDEETGKDDHDSVVRRRIEIEGLLFGISIEFSKIKIGPIEKPIEPPIDLGMKEVDIKKNILFFSHDK